jgi:hypothetical protein
MAGVADLLINVRAEVGDAVRELEKLGGALARATGGGSGTGSAIAAASGALAGTAVVSENIANKYQDTMARIQAAVNDVDFTPGSKKFEKARADLEQIAKSTNTPFERIGDSGEVWTRFFGGYSDQVTKATQATAEFTKVSRDMNDAMSTSQTVARFDRIFNSQNPSATMNALSALGQMHTQGEQTVMDTAQQLAPVAAMLGLSQGQVLGTSNYLVEEGVGGQFAGTAIGRMLLTMGGNVAKAVAAEDEDSDVTSKKKRTASDRIEDLQDSLAEAQEKRAEMYDSRGRLKRNYIRHPSEVMRADNQIAHLQRNIGEQQTDLADMDDPFKAVRGEAKLAGMDPQAFVDLYQKSPFDALKAVATNLHGKSATEQSALLQGATSGKLNQRDVRTLAALGVDPNLLNQMVGTADTALVDPTSANLSGRYGVVRDTRSQDIGSVRVAATSDIANKTEAADQAIAQAAQDSGLIGWVKQAADAFMGLPEPVKNLTTGLLEFGSIPIISALIAGARSRGASLPSVPTVPNVDLLSKLPKSVTPPSPTVASDALISGGLLGKLGVIGTALALADAVADTVDMGAQFARDPSKVVQPHHVVSNAIIDRLTGNQPGGGQGSIQISVPNVSVSVGSPADIGQAASMAAQQVYDQIINAWNGTRNAPSPQLGGAR